MATNGQCDECRQLAQQAVEATCCDVRAVLAIELRDIEATDVHIENDWVEGSPEEAAEELADNWASEVAYTIAQRVWTNLAALRRHTLDRHGDELFFTVPVEWKHDG